MIFDGVGRIMDRVGTSPLAESEGFEPSVPVTQYGSLANCWFQPLTHDSATRQTGGYTQPPPALQPQRPMLTYVRPWRAISSGR